MEDDIKKILEKITNIETDIKTIKKHFEKGGLVFDMDGKMNDLLLMQNKVETHEQIIRNLKHHCKYNPENYTMTS